MKVINIYSKGSYPANILSNFAPNSFYFDSESIACMEALLQSLKFNNANDQRKILNLSGNEAKEIGSTQKWHRYLFWKGQRIDRFSKEYIAFLENAYSCMLKNPSFKNALEASKGSILMHTIGKTRRCKTVLTWWEFIHILYKLRKEL